MSKEKVEVVLEILAKAKPNIEKFSGYKEGMYSGPIIATLARKSLAYIQDAEAKLRSIYGPGLTVVPNDAAPKPTANIQTLPAAPANPVAVTQSTVQPTAPVATTPELKIKVAWKALKAVCPVCNQDAQMGLIAKAQLGDGKATIELLVCSECITLGPPKDSASEGQPETEILPADKGEAPFSNE